MTTLDEELEQAAEHMDMAADEAASCDYVAQAGRFYDRAARLRQRAAWVRERIDAFEAQAFNGSDRGDDILGVLKRLTGPIPSETAPAAPKEDSRG